MRILMVTDVYPPLIGGVERQMQLLGQKLIGQGHSVGVATAWQVGLAEQEQDAGIQVYRLKGLASRIPWFSSNPGRRHHPPCPDPGTVWGLRRVLRQFRPDVIHAYGWITYSCAVALIGTKIPLLLSVREYGYTCAIRTMMRYGTQLCEGPAPLKCLDCAMHTYGPPKGLAATIGVFTGRRLLRRTVKGVHSVSTYMQKNIRRDLFGHQRSIADPAGNPLPDVVIPSFRDRSRDNAGQDHPDVQACLKRLPGEPYILFVGALRQVKGLKPLLAAYQMLAQRLPVVPPLVLIGVPAVDTPKEFPANVTVLYNFPHAAVMAAWEGALLGVMPSIWPEPFGSVIHEAMSKGKAVISTTPGGQTDMIIDEQTGLLVPANDAEALAAAMQRLIQSPELCKRLGQAAEVRANLFVADIVVPRFEQLYRELVHMSPDHMRGDRSFQV